MSRRHGRMRMSRRHGRMRMSRRHGRMRMSRRHGVCLRIHLPAYATVCTCMYMRMHLFDTLSLLWEYNKYSSTSCMQQMMLLKIQDFGPMLLSGMSQVAVSYNYMSIKQTIEKHVDSFEHTVRAHTQAWRLSAVCRQPSEYRLGPWAQALSGTRCQLCLRRRYSTPL
jgi:hypothetical protein